MHLAAAAVSRSLDPLLHEAGVALALALHLRPARQQPRRGEEETVRQVSGVVGVFLDVEWVIVLLCGSSWNLQAVTAPAGVTSGLARPCVSLTSRAARARVGPSRQSPGGGDPRWR
jgi:hypothetical protein